ncbi:hypothetical protein ACFQH6_04945 [Halobacteriaceae archaeon GCM10025711]
MSDDRIVALLESLSFMVAAVLLLLSVSVLGDAGIVVFLVLGFVAWGIARGNHNWW